MSVISGAVKISKPYHSESRTVWYVTDVTTEEIITTIEIGSVFVYASGARYEIFGVDQPTNRVTVARVGCRTVYTWHVSSLVCGLKLSV